MTVAVASRPSVPAVELDAFATAYAECALWTATLDHDGYLPLTFGLEDLPLETLARMAQDCRRFVESLPADLYDRMTDRQDWGRAGHDFWLTRSREGAGFWDGGWPEEVGARLTDLAHAFGEVTLYVGDDGRVYQGQG